MALLFGEEGSKLVYIRSNTWLQDSLSWASVIIGLGNAFEELGHRFFPISTNGMNEKLFNRPNIMSQSIVELERLKRNNIPVDLDLTYTVPQNFPQRFLRNSKHKAAIYAFEYRHWTSQWKQFYGLPNLYFPPSNFAAEIFYLNGIPKDKIFVVPHGVDTNKFNPNISKYPLKTNKTFRFVSVVAPHSRKRIDVLLNAYCSTFTAKDDVCLVLKTKLYRAQDKGRQAYEVCVGDYLDALKNKHGLNMPEIEVIQERVDSVASIYNACHVNVSTTGSECGYLPGLESMACGLINIAPGYSGHLDYMNADNSLLIDYKMTKAKREDQYWGYDDRNKIAQASTQHTSDLMRTAYNEHDMLLKRFGPRMKQVVEQYSWKNAAQRIIDCCNGKVEHYKPETIRLPK